MGEPTFIDFNIANKIAIFNQSIDQSIINQSINLFVFMQRL